MRKNLKNIGLIAAGLATGVFATLQISASAQPTNTEPLPLDQLRLFAEVFGQIKHEYVTPVDDKKLLTAAIKGMVASLDPHSSYLDKTDYQELQEQTKGRFAGLGIEISSEDGLIKVISPIEDTPAFRAGIRPGDLITRINDKPVRGMTRLKDTVARVLPLWNESIAPAIKSGKKIVIAAHGNSIRALVKYLDNISDDDIVGLNIPNGVPLVYELDENLKPITHYYLGDADAIAKAQAAVANQGKAA